MTIMKTLSWHVTIMASSSEHKTNSGAPRAGEPNVGLNSLFLGSDDLMGRVKSVALCVIHCGHIAASFISMLLAHCC